MSKFVRAVSPRVGGFLVVLGGFLIFASASYACPYGQRDRCGHVTLIRVVTSLVLRLRQRNDGTMHDLKAMNRRVASDDAASEEVTLVEREEAGNRLDALQLALGVLNPRERRIFVARRLVDQPMTLEALFDEFGISRERVRQIEIRVFDKVQSAVKAKAARPRPRRVALSRLT
jgi:Sigma-70, region 4